MAGTWAKNMLFGYGCSEMPDPEFFKQQAARCRRLAAGISDRSAIAALLELAEEFERRADSFVEERQDAPARPRLCPVK